MSITLRYIFGLHIRFPADVAQRQSKGLISPWPVVRFHPSAPHPAFCVGSRGPRDRSKR